MTTAAKLPTPTVENWDWQALAACRGMDAALFFHPDNERGPSRRRREQQAKAVCGRCPVRQACLDWAVAVGEAHGVWGGSTPEERAVLLGS